MSIPNRIARLHTDGSTDGGFDPGSGLNAEGLCVAALPDGRVVAGGGFTAVNGAARFRLAVLEADGSLAETSLTMNGAVRCVLCQTDGKVLVAGDFTTLNGITRRRAARLKSDFALEAAFDPNADDKVYAAALRADGRVMTGGAFAHVGSAARSALALLYNDDAGSIVSVESAEVVQWLRTGAGHETLRAGFEISTDSGATWEALGGTVARIPGGWKVTGLSLSGSGDIRARAYPQEAGAEGMHESACHFNFVPVITVAEDVTGAPSLTNGAATVTFDDTETGAGSVKSFIIRNTGLTDLTLTADVTVTGANYAVVTPADPVISPGGSATFSVTFDPATVGVKTSTLTITSDDGVNGTFTISLLGLGTPGVGARDAAYQPTFNGDVYSLAVTDDLLFVGGEFSTVNGSNQGHYAWLDSLAKVRAAGGTGANGTVHCTAVLPDGKILIGGEFTSFNGAARKGLARLNADGTLDTKFTVGVSTGGFVLALLVQEDGGVIVGGSFNTFGVVKTKGLGRLTALGAVDPSIYNPGVSIQTLALLPDGKILIGGWLNIYRAPNQYYGLARLNANGSFDDSFVLHFSDSRYLVQAFAITTTNDGKILIAGIVRVGSTNTNQLIRVNADGAVDDTFTPLAAKIFTVAAQCDGKVIAGGEKKLLRLDAAGGEDAAFPAATTGGTVRALALAEGGAIYAGGNFVFGGESFRLAKVANDHLATPNSVFSVISASELCWQRTGIAPTAQLVTFDLSEDDGANWTRLGKGTLAADDWTLSGIALPIAGLVRARARLRGGFYNGSDGMHEARVNLADYHLNVADLQLRTSAGSRIAPGETLAFPALLPTQSENGFLVIDNTGRADLTGIAITITGTEWTVTSIVPTTLPAGENATITLRFRPAISGARTATLTVRSSVPGVKGSYAISLSGGGIATATAASIAVLSGSITSSQARLLGAASANDNAGAASAWFEYKRNTDTVWIKATGSEVSISGFTATSLGFDLTGLTHNTAYNYRVAVYNSINPPPAAAVYSTAKSFTTLA